MTGFADAAPFAKNISTSARWMMVPRSPSSGDEPISPERVAQTLPKLPQLWVPFAKNAKVGAAHYVGDASEIKRLGPRPKKFDRRPGLN